MSNKWYNNDINAMILMQYNIILFYSIIKYIVYSNAIYSVCVIQYNVYK